MEITDQSHLVLGGSGAVGQAVIADLKARGLPVRGLERSKIIEGVETIKADLRDKDETIRALKGSTHVYMCIGLPYKTKVWEKEWPIVIQNVIDGCASSNSKLIFMDNIYMYGQPLPIPFDENTPQQPPSKKGVVRKKIVDMILKAHADGKVQAVIGRSADFYGPYAKMSMFYISFLENMLSGKAAQSIAKPNFEHTFAYTGDVGKALVLLANDDETYGQTWHLPVGKPILQDEMAGLFNAILKTNFKLTYIPRFLLHILSLFVAPIREVKEMLYQFDAPYVMSDQKFLHHFPEFQKTSYEEGAKKMVQHFHAES